MRHNVRRKVRGIVVAAMVMVLAGGLGLAHRPAASGAHLASGTCYEIYQGTLTPGEPMTVCT
jgi:hypothetical protein